MNDRQSLLLNRIKDLYSGKQAKSMITDLIEILESLNNTELSELEETVDNLTRYKARLKISGVSVNFALRPDKGNLIPVLTKIQTNNSLMIINCGHINNGNIKIPMRLLYNTISNGTSTQCKFDMTGLNWEMQDEMVIEHFRQNFQI
jgi:hypothetical protein